MSQPLQKAARALVSPDTTLVNPAPLRTAENRSADSAVKTEQTYADGSEKPRDKAAALAGATASAAPLIPVPAPVPARMQLLEQRLQAQRRAGPSAAEAERRLMQLRHEARRATSARGPRTARGLFKASCSTDLCFVLDATGSMQQYLDAAKDQIKDIVREIHSAFFDEADVRVAVVAYRDHNDGEDRLKTLDFTDDVGAVHAFLHGLVSGGGGDLPEDVLGGLDAALALSWRHATRCVMHIADAPGHGRDLNEPLQPGADVYYDKPEPHGLKYIDVLARMVAREINYVFFRISNATDRMTSRFMYEYALAAPDARLHPQNLYAPSAARDMAYARVQKIHAQKSKARALARSTGLGPDPGPDPGPGPGPGPGDTFTAGALNGGLHFEEVMLGVSYGELSRLVVSGVAASSSRTAVRLTASSSASAPSLRSKRAYQKAKLGDVAEDAELEVFYEAAERLELDGGDDDKEGPEKGRGLDGDVDKEDPKRKGLDGDDIKEEPKTRQGLDSATTHVGSETADDDADTGRWHTAPVALETDPPQWQTAGWLDQTIRCKAFSPDVVSMQPPSAPDGNGYGDGYGYGASPEQPLDRMIESDDHIPMSTTELTILRRSRPFAQGALRTASYARTPQSTNPLVVKTFKRGGKTLADLAEDMRLQALCKAFAFEFNSLVAHELFSLDFVVVTCLQPAHAAAADDACMTLEPLLATDDGQYVKYNNNCGGVSRLGDDPTATDEADAGAGTGKKKKPANRRPGLSKREAKTIDLAEAQARQARRARRDALAAHNMAAQAFSHFTFERSRGRMLVVDLQGVGHVLTDPAVHTRDPTRFVLSDTNLNEDGFKLFFATHRCDFLCRHLRLRSHAAMFRSGGDFAFRADWRTDWTPPAVAAGLWKRPPVPAHQNRDITSFGSLPNMLVCCANKLCSRIVQVSSAQAAPAGVFWCARCWPQLRASTVLRVCATPGAYHEFEVSAFFFESQGQILPSTCTAHGGGVSQPQPPREQPSPAKRKPLLKRLFGL